MGDHYLPQFYLRGFEADGRLWAYDKAAGRNFRTKVKSIANEKGMYSEQLESYLATQIEDPAKPAIAKIRERQEIAPGDRLSLAKYIYFLWKRVPRARQRMIARLPQIADQIHARLNAQLDAAATQQPEFSEKVQRKKEQIAEVIAKYRQDPPPQLWHRSIQSQSGPQVVDAFLSMNWVFLYSETLQFLTGDNPVFFFEHEGIGRETSELTLPLSSSIALWASRLQRVADWSLTASPSAVRELNRRTAHNSSRFIYAQRDEAWILPFAMRRRWRLTRLRL